MEPLIVFVDNLKDLKEEDLKKFLVKIAETAFQQGYEVGTLVGRAQPNIWKQNERQILDKNEVELKRIYDPFKIT